MNHVTERRPATILGMEQFPWPTLLFLATVFFLALHDLHYSQKAIEDFNPSENDLIALADAGSTTRRIAMLALGVFGVVSLMRSGGIRLRIQGILGWTILLYTGWAILSLTWAQDTSLTLRRLVVFVILCVAAVAIARRCSTKEIVFVTFFWSLIYLLVGVSAELILGNFHPVASGYRFAGTQHPNSEGVNCALLLLSGLAAGDIERPRRAMFRACAALGLLCLILTGSRTAFAAAVAGLTVYWIMTSSRAAKMIAIPLALSALFCLLVISPGEGALTTLRSGFMLGRGDSNAESFNGRSEIWEKVEVYIRQRPIAGYGYGGFWTERHISDISAEQDWPVGSAHSAFRECMLSLGWVGLIAYIAAFGGGIQRSITLHRSTHAASFAFCTSFLIFCLTNGLLDSFIIDLTLVAFLIMITLTRLAFVSEAALAESG
jgi:exopolysaccharide production protein ExoQ